MKKMLILLLFLAACQQAADTTQNENRLHYTISIGTIGEDAADLIERFQPTIDYIAEKLSTESVSYTGKVIIAKNVDHMIQLLSSQELDLFLESPFTASVIMKETGARAILRRWKSGVAEYSSVIFVKEDSDIESINELVGKNIAFEAEESTSGYLLPYSYLLKNNLIVTRDAGADGITYTFSGEDINTPAWVLDGRVDAGAVANTGFEQFENKDEFRIIAETMKVPRHLVLHRSGLSQELVGRIVVILKDMENDPEGKVIMNSFKDTLRYDDIPEKEAMFAGVDEMLAFIG